MHRAPVGDPYMGKCGANCNGGAATVTAPPHPSSARTEPDREKQIPNFEGIFLAEP
jgi:hypothetical protein